MLSKSVFIVLLLTSEDPVPYHAGLPGLREVAAGLEEGCHLVASPVQEYKGEVGGYLKTYMKINRKLGTPTSQASHTHKLICPAMRLMGTGKRIPRAGILGLCLPIKLGRVQNCLWMITDSCHSMAECAW